MAVLARRPAKILMLSRNFVASRGREGPPSILATWRKKKRRTRQFSWRGKSSYLAQFAYLLHWSCVHARSWRAGVPQSTILDGRVPATHGCNPSYFHSHEDKPRL
jgi:hypothetical protein